MPFFMRKTELLILLTSISLLGFAPWFWIGSTPPALAIVNESMAWLGWAMLGSWIFFRGRHADRLAGPVWSWLPLAVLFFLALAVVVDVLRGRLPYPGQGLLVVFYLAMAAWCFCAGRNAADVPERGLMTWEWLAKAWIFAALLTVAIGAWQFLRPAGAYPWVAALSYPGRVFGNLRQPNHMATMVAMGWLLLVWLSVERRQVRIWLMLIASSALLAGMALTGSRTGAVIVLVSSTLLGAAFWWRQQWRWWVLLFPLVYGLTWVLLAWLDQSGLYASFGVDRLRQMPQGSDVTGARRDAWLVTWDIIAAYPWTGVGTGRFGFFFMLGDWSRPVTLQFNNAHNLFLHLAAEHGIPLLVFALGAMTWFLAKCLQHLRRDDPYWIAFVLPIPVLIHSQFEYPLWYSFFLFPLCFALGSMSSARWVVPLVERTRPSAKGQAGLWVLATVLMSAPFVMLWSNHNLRAIYFPDETPLAKRVQLAQSSFLFRHHADHALLSTAPPELTNAVEVGPLYSAVAQVLTDASLIRSWTIHSAMNGDIQQAKHLAHALWNLNPDMFVALRARVQKASDPQLAELAAYMQNPTAVPHPLEALLRGQSSDKAQP